MLDVTAPAGLLPAASHDVLLRRLGETLLQAEGAPLAAPYLENTGVFVHEPPRTSVATADQRQAAGVRVQVTTPPGALDRQGQRDLVAAATEAVVDAAGDPSHAARTSVLLLEAAEGGWGVGGFALGQEGFAALRAGG